MSLVHRAPVGKKLSRDSWRLSTGRWDSREEWSEIRRSDNTHLTVPAAVIWCWNQAPALFDLPVKTHTYMFKPKSLIISPQKVGNWCTFGLTFIFNTNEELEKLFKGWIELPNLQEKCSQSVALFHKSHTSTTLTSTASPQSTLPAQRGHQICPVPWICWNTCLNWSVLCASGRWNSSEIFCRCEDCPRNNVLMIISTTVWSFPESDLPKNVVLTWATVFSSLERLEKS